MTDSISFSSRYAWSSISPVDSISARNAWDSLTGEMKMNFELSGIIMEISLSLALYNIICTFFPGTPREPGTPDVPFKPGDPLSPRRPYTKKKDDIMLR